MYESRKMSQLFLVDRGAVQNVLIGGRGGVENRTEAADVQAAGFIDNDKSRNPVAYSQILNPPGRAVKSILNPRPSTQMFK